MKMRSCLLAVRQVPAVLLVGVAVLGVNSLVQAAEFTVPVGGDIQSAIDGAVAGDVIQLEPGEYLPTKTIVIDKGVTLRGATLVGGEPVSTINGQGSIRVLECNGANLGDGEIRLEMLKVVNGHFDGVGTVFSGGGLYITGCDPKLKDCAFDNNSARYGGAVYNYEGNPTFTDCVFTNNSADREGGAVATRGDGLVLNFDGCRFEANISQGDGGAVSCFSPGAGESMCDPFMTAWFEGCHFESNEAADNGGACWHPSTTSEYRNCRFYLNSAGQDGGGVLSTKVSRAVTYEFCEFIENTAGNSGGGISHGFIDPGECTGQLIALEFCTFTRNTANESGGGAYLWGVEKFTATDSTFEGNESGAHCSDGSCGGADGGGGGGVYLDWGLAVLDRCTFEGNAAWSKQGNGGGASFSGKGTVIRDCTFTCNEISLFGFSSGSVYRGGAGLYLKVDTGVGYQADVSNSVFRQNRCTRDPAASPVKGGGVFTGTGTMHFSECKFESNFAWDGGGGLYSSQSGGTITECTVKECSAETTTGFWGLEFLPSYGMSTVAYTLTDNLLCGNGTNQIDPVSNQTWFDGGGNSIEETCSSPADLDGNGSVDGADLASLLADWGCTGCGCSADLTRDGLVNGQDLAQLLGDWG